MTTTSSSGSSSSSTSTSSITSCFLNNTHLVKSWVLMVKPSESRESQSTESSASEGEGGEEYYEVELVQPYGLKFVKGRDGGTYIDAIAPGGSADSTGLFTVGDKVVATRCLISYSTVIIYFN